jgi:hypothetical protein
MYKQLSDLKNAVDVDIREPDISTYLTFKNPQAIKNHKEWEDLTNEFIREADEIKIIAQTGEWIIKDGIRDKFECYLERGGKIKLITCEKFPSAGLHSKRQDEIENTLREMAINSEKGTIEIEHLKWGLISEKIKLNGKEGMYMKRIAKTSIVAPVRIVDKEDYELLEKMFNYYWRNCEPS